MNSAKCAERDMLKFLLNFKVIQKGFIWFLNFGSLWHSASYQWGHFECYGSHFWSWKWTTWLPSLGHYTVRTQMPWYTWTILYHLLFSLLLLFFNIFTWIDHFLWVNFSMIQTSSVASTMLYAVTDNIFRDHLLKLCIKIHKEVCQENMWFISSLVHYEIGWDHVGINMKYEVCWKCWVRQKDSQTVVVETNRCLTFHVCGNANNTKFTAYNLLLY